MARGGNKPRSTFPKGFFAIIGVIGVGILFFYAMFATFGGWGIISSLIIVAACFFWALYEEFAMRQDDKEQAQNWDGQL